MARTSRGVMIRDEGGDVALAQVLDFVGSAVVASDQGSGVVRATISGGAATLTPVAPTGGAINDTNVTFTFASKPTLIVVNGSAYEENKGWSWSVLTATLDAPVGANGDIYGL